MPAASQSRRFIHRVWRRMVAIRIAESFAIGLSIGAAAGLAMMPLAWWAERPALPVAVGMLAVGAVAGLLRGMFSGPSHLQAALEADKQLNLHDLLGTLLMMEKLPVDTSASWRNAIVAMAEDRCRDLRPSAVIVHRLGLRAWGSVGILSGLLLAIGILITRPQASSAGFSTSHTLGSVNLAQRETSSHPSNSRPAGDNLLNELSPRSFPVGRPDSESDLNAVPANGQSRDTHSAGGSSGSGQGLATSQTPSANPANLTDEAGASSKTGNGDYATGSGRESDSGNASGKSGNGQASAAAGNHIAPPWQSDRWSADAAAAQDAVKRGTVPDADADLVRDYFTKE